MESINSVKVQTDHYNFNMNVVEKYNISHISYTFLVGNPENPA
jgi:hypothetical protein